LDINSKNKNWERKKPMDQEKITQHFMKTGVLGAYETAGLSHNDTEGGRQEICFDDALVVSGKTQTTTERTMYIEGRRYNISSVFPSDTRHTPTEKMLALIDIELKK